MDNCNNINNIKNLNPKMNYEKEWNSDNQFRKIEQNQIINFSYMQNFKEEIKNYILEQIQLSENKNQIIFEEIIKNKVSCQTNNNNIENKFIDLIKKTSNEINSPTSSLIKNNKCFQHGIIQVLQ